MSSCDLFSFVHSLVIMFYYISFPFFFRGAPSRPVSRTNISGSLGALYRRGGYALLMSKKIYICVEECRAGQDKVVAVSSTTSSIAFGFFFFSFFFINNACPPLRYARPSSIARDGQEGGQIALGMAFRHGI